MKKNEKFYFDRKIYEEKIMNVPWTHLKNNKTKIIYIYSLIQAKAKG